jgi:hypothetical protein
MAPAKHPKSYTEVTNPCIAGEGWLKYSIKSWPTMMPPNTPGKRVGYCLTCMLNGLAISPCSYPKSIITYTMEISKGTMQARWIVQPHTVPAATEMAVCNAALDLK